MSRRGFTMIELMVALAIISLLLSLAAPRYFAGVIRAKEAVLHENLYCLREAIDKYRSDKGRYPDTLDELVTNHYLRQVPLDPMLERRDAWALVAPEETGAGAIADVKSAAPGSARDGTRYADW